VHHDSELIKSPVVPQGNLMSFSGYGPQAKVMMLSTVLAGVGGTFFSFLFTLYLQELVYGPEAIGLILMIMGFTATLPLLPAGYLGDRFGRKPMMLIGLAMTAVSPLVVVYSNGFILLCCGAVLWGFGQSFYAPAFLTLMAEKVSDRRRKYLYSLQSFVGMISGACTILVAGFTPKLLSGLMGTSLIDGYRMAFQIGSFFLLLQYPFLLTLDEKRKDGVPLRVFAKGCEPAVAMVRKEPPPMPWRTIFSLCLPMVLIGIGAGLIVPFFQLYFTWRFDTPVWLIGVLFSVTQFFWGMAYLVMPYVSDRIGSVRAITVVQSFAIMALVGIPISPSFHFVAVMYIIRMVAMNSAWPILQSYSVGQVPEEHRSFTLSATNFSFNVPKGLTPGIGGYIYGFSLELPFFLCAAFYTASTIMFFTLFKDRDDKEAPFDKEDASVGTEEE
jgi:MFS family permease